MTSSYSNRTQSIFNKMENVINNIPKMSDKHKSDLIKAFMAIRDKKVNILITGATGAGKSSTINAIFGEDKAKVGHIDPETMSIEKYDLDSMILWDSPGLGDGIENDKVHSKNIINKINQLDKDGHPVIDLVLVILDGSSRDYGTSYDLINRVIIPHLEDKKRIMVAINQCDIAMKGKGWDDTENEPTHELELFLEGKIDSVRNRIYESTRVRVEPIVFSAEKRYNISKLLSYIIKMTPEKKRWIYASNMNKDKTAYQSSDSQINYNKEIKTDIVNSIGAVAAGAGIGAAIGSFIPVIGTGIGAALGGAISWFLSKF